ncbi:hypothetical protein [Parasitella parasitica]|uniref:Uncharacterized protein n=1 Tax=Parasitella parasitica TaxID=35722 RepID=A0A0B7MUJ8_9FUNG|nr:hypothetical protein [Parasitella parasitica]
MESQISNKPPVNKRLAVNYTRTNPALCFKGKTIARLEENGQVMYEVALDELNDKTIKIHQGSLKYVGPVITANETVVEQSAPEDTRVATEDMLEDAI